ncbi:DNA polymerase III subunit gamma and tau [Nocardia sp. NPDC050712]|uniref:DNA polymerase III subunit gamma and tau n=1 Tax=Nocardia sp. NPDC050712 TaxID=3155518 RepID=UPI0033D36310
MALYRKYRPATFAEVVGQEHVTDPISTALDTGRISHAYLFSGPRGCGKTSSARILARSLNCAEGPTSRPCGVCPSCVALGPGGPGNLDVIELDAASHGGVDDTRELRDRAFYAPAESRYRVFIVDEAHMVTTAGFNALLKIVEEPPAHLIFIFATTEPEKVLPTIRSRTHHYPFRLLPPATMRGLLGKICEQENVAVEEAVYPLVIRAGGGSPRDSLSVLDQLLAGAGPEGVTYNRAVSLLGVTDVALIDDAVEALAADDGATLFDTVDRVMEAGHDPRRFAVDLLERFRDLILMRAVPDAVERNLVTGPGDVLERMGGQAQRLGAATLARYAELLHAGLGEMRGATAPRLLLEIVCARMLLPSVSDAESATLQRLERLERGVATGTPLPAVAGGAPVPAEAAPRRPAAAADPSRRRGAEALAALRAKREGPAQNADQSPARGSTPQQATPTQGAQQGAAATGGQGSTAGGHVASQGSAQGASQSNAHGSNAASAEGAADTPQQGAAAAPAQGATASTGGQGSTAGGHVASPGSAQGAGQPNAHGSNPAVAQGAASGTPQQGAASEQGAHQASAPGTHGPGEAQSSGVSPAQASAANSQSSDSGAQQASAGGQAPQQASASGEGSAPSAAQTSASVGDSDSVDAPRFAGGDPQDHVQSAAAQGSSASDMQAAPQEPVREAQQGSGPAAQGSAPGSGQDSASVAPSAGQQGVQSGGDSPIAQGAEQQAVQGSAPVSHAAGEQVGDGVPQHNAGAERAVSAEAEVTQTSAAAPQSPIDGTGAGPESAAAALAPEPVSAPAMGAESDELLRSVEAAWADIRAKVREFGAAVQALLSGASVARIDGDVIVFAHQHAPLAKRLSEPRNIEAVRSAVRAVLGREHDIRWEAGAAVARPAAAATKAPRAGGQPGQPARGGAAASGPAAPPRFSRPSQAKNVQAGAAQRSGPEVKPYGDDDIPPPDFPDLPDDPGPFDSPPEPGGESVQDAVPRDLTPEEEQEFIAEAAVPVAPEDRRDPDEVALELLRAELGATRIDG